MSDSVWKGLYFKKGRINEGIPMTQLKALPTHATDNNGKQRLAIIQSPIGKKLLTGVTGLGLVLFVIVHLLGNLLLFVSPGVFNDYAHGLEQVKPLVISIEIALVASIMVHMGLGIRIYLSRLKARPVGYVTYQSAGQPSQQSISSNTMIFTGLSLGVFLVWHLMSFKFGPWYVTDNSSEPIRDLARLVIETFQRPLNTVGYVAVMILLGFHLRHGIWSAFQSLGVMTKSSQVLVYSVGTILAVAIATGFMLLPLSILAGWVG